MDIVQAFEDPIFASVVFLFFFITCIICYRLKMEERANRRRIVVSEPNIVPISIQSEN